MPKRGYRTANPAKSFSKGYRKKRVARRRPQPTRGRRGIYRTAGLLGFETKFHDSSLSGTALVSTTGATGGEVDPATILCLNGVPQGDTSSSRDGMKISMKSLFINGQVYVQDANTVTAAQASPNIYIALVLDTQTNGAQLSSENVFTNPSASAANANIPLRNMSYTERFKVLKVKQTTIKPTIFHDGTDAAISGCSMPFKMQVDLKGMMTKFQTGTTTGYVGTIIDNSLHLIAFTDSVDMTPRISYHARLRYTG